MTISLDHTIVPAQNKVAAAEFFTRITGLPFDGVKGHFAPVQVNPALTLDFADAEAFEHHHYGFLVSPEELAAILAQIQAAGAPYGSGPGTGYDSQTYHRRGLHGVYVRSPEGHSYEFFAPE